MNEIVIYESLAIDIINFIDHLQYERRLSLHTVDNYKRDLTQCATFLSKGTLNIGIKYSYRIFDCFCQRDVKIIKRRARLIEKFPCYDLSIVIFCVLPKFKSIP